MECPQCGYALGPFDRECPRCSSIKERRIAPFALDATQLAETTPAPQQPVSILTQPVAPVASCACVCCGSGAVAKVSAVHGGGIWSAASVGVGGAYGLINGGGSFEAIGVNSTSSKGSSYIAALLAPPPEPPGIVTNDERNFAGLVFLVPLLIVGIFTALSDLARDIWIGLMVADVLVMLGFGIRVAAVRDTKRAIMAARRANWQKCVARWYELYYCSTCDRVYHPVSHHWVPSQDLRQLMIDGMSKGKQLI